MINLAVIINYVFTGPSFQSLVNFRNYAFDESNMYKILEKSALNIHKVKLDKKRYLYNRIDYRNRFIAIQGARGTGKTTLLLQLAKKHNNLPNALYISSADLYFTDKTLYELVQRFAKQGGRLLLLDDVQSLPHWPDELRKIYTEFADVQVIFTCTSLLDINKAPVDISKRIATYHLKELSFREFVFFRHGIEFPVVSLTDLLTHHESIATETAAQYNPLQYIPDYLKHGAYPSHAEDAFLYNERLLQNVHLTLEVDMPAIENSDFLNVTKFKRLLRHVHAQAPLLPTILPLSKEMELTRNATVRMLQLLDKAALVHALYAQTRGITVLNKPDKVWPGNTNLLHALASENTSASTRWETFLLQHVTNEHIISLSDAGEFVVNERLTLAFGGKEKGLDGTDRYILKDDLTKGSGHIIPLWMVGLVY